MRKSLDGCMMGKPWNLPRLFALSVALSLRMLPPQERRPLRACRRHPLRGRHRPFSGPPEPPSIAPSRMGQPLRCTGSRTDRLQSPTQAPSPLSARRHRRGALRLRRLCERVGPLRCGVQPRARILLPSFSPLRRPAHRGGLGLPVHRTTGLRARELDRSRGRAATPTRPRRQRGRHRAGEVIPAAVRSFFS